MTKQINASDGVMIVFCSGTFGCSETSDAELGLRVHYLSNIIILYSLKNQHLVISNSPPTSGRHLTLRVSRQTQILKEYCPLFF